MPSRTVYLDHAATTPLDPKVWEAMEPYLREHFGNASSVHALGRKARVAVEASRERVAAALGAEPAEIVFTSGGSEADNLALKGVLARRPGTLVTSAVEHEAVLKPAEARQRAGEPAAILTPSSTGAVTPEQLADAWPEQTALVSLMYVNNELGTVADVSALADVAHDRGALFHTDAVQAAGLFDLDVDALGVDLLSLSGHKIYGPKGVGVLYVRGGVDLQTQVEGGAQERRRRAGTENVAAIVGLGEAVARAEAGRAERAERITALRTHLLGRLREGLGEAFVVNTPIETARVAPHILNIAFPERDGRTMDGEMLLLNLDMEGVYVSSGSACTSGALEPSHVLRAIGRDRATAAAAVRFSLGHTTTEADLDYAAERLTAIVDRMRLL